MSQISIAPTKGALIIIKDELHLAVQAHELLERKREVLINELMRYVHEMRDAERRFQEKFTAGLKFFIQARGRLGQLDCDQAMAFEVVENQINVLHRSVMGVHILELSVEKAAREPLPGPAGSVPELEEAYRALHEALILLGPYVTRLSAVWRLVTEVKKTQRRVNALENIFIPRYIGIRDFIQAVLEENEREEFFRQKRVKNKLAESA
jgi:V/A-type H+-transporting ATPase subunit D